MQRKWKVLHTIYGFTLFGILGIAIGVYAKRGFHMALEAWWVLMIVTTIIRAPYGAGPDSWTGERDALGGREGDSWALIIIALSVLGGLSWPLEALVYVDNSDITGVKATALTAIAGFGFGLITGMWWE